MNKLITSKEVLSDSNTAIAALMVASCLPEESVTSEILSVNDLPTPVNDLDDRSIRQKSSKLKF